jgi:CTP:molybdopterin cytidylyltransferase MocA
MAVVVANSGRHQNRMSVKKKDSRQHNASRWAAGLMKSVRAVLAARPEAQGGSQGVAEEIRD